MFCCMKCREEALSTYHKYECKLVDLFLSSGKYIIVVIIIITIIISIIIIVVITKYRRLVFAPQVRGVITIISTAAIALITFIK